MPETTSSLADLHDGDSAILSLSSGETVTVMTGSPDPEATSGGIIYTAEDMPSLEEILSQLDVITAVLERPVPQVPPPSADAQTTPANVLATWRLMLAAGLPSAVTAGGLVLFTDSVGEVRPNPYIALFLLLGGCVLIATAALAIRSYYRS